MNLSYILPDEFKECITTTLMDSIFGYASPEMQWRLWLNATSAGSQRDWNQLVQNMIYDGYDMETWIAAAVSQRKAINGELEWISGVL